VTCSRESKSREIDDPRKNVQGYLVQEQFIMASKNSIAAFFSERISETYIYDMSHVVFVLHIFGIVASIGWCGETHVDF
jgi:hypothetical protein